MKMNILIVGYPKSGTTWLTRLVAELTQSPAVGYWLNDNYSNVTEGLDRVSSSQCFQSHHIYQELSCSPNDKIIYLIRDPRAVVVSAVHHFTFGIRAIKENIHWLPYSNKIYFYLLKLINLFLSKEYKFQRVSSAILQGDKYISKWCEYSWSTHVQSYSKQNVLVLKYEDLISNPVEECQKIGYYLNANLNDERIKTAIEKQSFKKRKADFDRKGMKNQSKHLREGKANAWRKELPEKYQQQLTEALKPMLESLEYLSSLG